MEPKYFFNKQPLYSKKQLEKVRLKAFEAGRGLTKDNWEQSDWEAFETLKPL